MKILIIGGHLSPALALIDEIENKKDILFIGRKYALEGDKSLSLEYKVCQEKGIPFQNINTGRLQRSFTRHTLTSFSKIPAGFFQSIKILKNFNPDVVMGFGGYVSLPVVMAAYFLRIPVVIHEQTLEAGAANKLESIFATRICISFEKSRDLFPRNKTILTGNPIRKAIKSPKSDIELPSENIPLIYITGGSLGSIAINSIVEKNLKELLSKYRIIHQTGSANNNYSLDRLKELKKSLGNEMRKRYVVSDHFSANDVGEILRRSSIVVSRAGINTISELLFLNKPAILIPISKTQRNEQLKNAFFLRDLGLAQVLQEKGLTSEEFLNSISSMVSNLDKYKLNDEKEYLKNDAALNILKVLENAAKKRESKTS